MDDAPPGRRPVDGDLDGHRAANAMFNDMLDAEEKSMAAKASAAQKPSQGEFESSLSSLLGEGLSNTLQFVNRARDTIAKLPAEQQVVFDKLNLPAIVVVGGQGAGKSTVLERLMGLNAMPRGAETRRNGSMASTKCPIETRLVRAPAGKERCDVEFNNDKVTCKLSELPKELLRMNAQAAVLAKKQDPRTDIYDKSIIVTIYSKAVIEELTFIDLPGIIINPEKETPGNCDRTLALALEKCKRKNHIILHIRNATMEPSQIVGGTTLDKAQKVDPDVYKRTIGVYTNLDALLESAKSDKNKANYRDKIVRIVSAHSEPDEPTQCFLLSNMNIDSEEFNGKKSWDAKQEDATEQKVLHEETNWPTGSRAHQAVAPFCGIAALRTALSRLLTERAEEGLRTMQRKLEDEINRINNELAKLPPAVEEDRKGEELNEKLHVLYQSLRTRSGVKIELDDGDDKPIADPKAGSLLKGMREEFFEDIDGEVTLLLKQEKIAELRDEIVRSASEEHASQDPIDLVLSPIGRGKVLRKFLEPMRNRTMRFCQEFKEAVLEHIVIPSIVSTFGGYPELNAEMKKILVSDGGGALWERQAMLANAEIAGHLRSLTKFFDPKDFMAQDYEHLKRKGLMPPEIDLVYSHYVHIFVRAKAIKSIIYRVLDQRLINDAIQVIRNNMRDSSDRQDPIGTLQNGGICIWQQYLFGVRSATTRQALMSIPLAARQALPFAVQKLIASAEKREVLFKAFRREPAVEVARNQLQKLHRVASELLRDYQELMNQRS